MQTRDSGLVIPGVGDWFEAEAERVASEKVKAIELGEMGVCWDCPRPATTPCPDGVARCADHSVAYAQAILDQAAESRRFVHRLSPAAKKARAKRRKAKKLAKASR